MTETFSQRVERLKKNEKGWLFLSKADRDCIRQANQHGKVENLTFAGEWENNTTGFSLADVGAHEVFRICPDYQPEPEYVDLPIDYAVHNQVKWLGVDFQERLGLPYPFTHLHCLPSLPGFRGFRYLSDIPLGITEVALKIGQKQQVVARFQKE